MRLIYKYTHKVDEDKNADIVGVGMILWVLMIGMAPIVMGCLLPCCTSEDYGS